jgi:hypothetical protein
MLCSICKIKAIRLKKTPQGEVCSNCIQYLIKQGLLADPALKEKKKPNHKVSSFVRKKMWAESRICGICCEEILRFEDASVDHIIPISKGGAVKKRENLQLAHQKCNWEKGSNLPESEV